MAAVDADADARQAGETHGDPFHDTTPRRRRPWRSGSLVWMLTAPTRLSRALRVAVAIAAAALVTLAVAVGVVYGRKAKAKAATATAPRVDLGYAAYAGTRLSVYPPSDAGGSSHNRTASPVAVDRFLGMRYAAAPLGDLRWRAPAALRTTTSLQPAQTAGPHCLGMNVQPGGSQDEDCLFVNVWAPAIGSAEAEDAAPVWIFIQGGGYTANSNADIDGADVVARSGGSVVYVNFNYRVGLYGFLASEHVRADGDLNAGLLDQRALLQWVQDHIAAFGGDPSHVVIHGGSAGAGSVALHTVAYGGRDDGLFVGAVAESVFLPTQPTVAELEYKFARAAAAGGCIGLGLQGVGPVGPVGLGPVAGPSNATQASNATVLACLRALSVETLQTDVNVATVLYSATNSTTSPPGFYWGPCVDGTLLEDRPYTLFRAGRFVRVPMLYGVATDEGTLFAADAGTEDEAVQFVVNNYPGLAAAASSTATTTNLAASVIAEHYPQAAAVPGHAAWFPTLADVYAELTFVCGAVNVLDAVHNATASAALFAYRYAMQDAHDMDAGLGTVHMMDAAAIFGPDNVGCCAPASYYGDGDTDASARGNPGLVPVMMDYYISFVRSLDPNTHRSANAAAWAPWRADSSGPRRLVITSGSNQTMERVPADQAERCSVWLSLADATEQ